MYITVVMDLNQKIHCWQSDIPPVIDKLQMDVIANIAIFDMADDPYGASTDELGQSLRSTFQLVTAPIFQVT